MNMVSFKISAKTIIEQARDFFREDWQGACAFLQGTLGCSFAEVIPLFTTETLVDGATPGSLESVPDPDAPKFVEEMQGIYRGRINVGGSYYRPCAEVLSYGPFWMAKQLGFDLSYPQWDEDPHPSRHEDGRIVNPVRGTRAFHYLYADEKLFHVDRRAIIFDLCEPPPPWMVCESPKDALAAWEAASEWLEPRGWIQEVRDYMVEAHQYQTTSAGDKPFLKKFKEPQPTPIVRRTFPGVTREQVEAAYAAHQQVIQAPWRESWMEFTGKAQRMAVVDLDRLVRACQAFVPADWFTQIMGQLGKAAHDLQFDGSRTDALVDIETGIIQKCHEFIGEAAVSLGLGQELAEKYEVRA